MDENWTTQLRKGVLELCILNIIGAGRIYGYDIVRQLRIVDALVVSEGTISSDPAELKRDGLVRTTLEESPSGPARSIRADPPRRAVAHRHEPGPGDAHPRDFRSEKGKHMMMALSPDAKGHLDQDLKTDQDGALRTRVNRRRRDRTRRPEPHQRGPVRRVRTGARAPPARSPHRLGEPNEWVPAEPSAWRRPFTALSSRPGDWRLAFVSFTSLVLTVILMTGRVMLWPLPLD